MSAATPAEVDALIQALASELESMEQRLADARGDLRRSEQQWRHKAEEAVAQVADTAGKSLRRERKTIEANVEELRSAALGVARSAVETQAPGYLSADWNEGIWTSQSTAQAGEWLRVGTVAIGSDRLPVVLPLSAGVWSVVRPTPGGVKALVQNTIARAAAAFDPLRVRVLAYDPELVLDLAAFAGLRAVSQVSMPPAITSEEEFEHALDILRTEVATVDDRLTAAGQNTYWTALAAGHPLAQTTPFRLLIIGSVPGRLSERGTARLDQVRRLASDRGLLILEWVDSVPPAANRPTTTLTLNDDTATTNRLPGLVWNPDPWAGDRFIRTLSSSLVERPRRSIAPTIDFEKIVDDIVDPWMLDADEGVEAVIGTIDGGDLVLRLRAENPPMPNALIGGAVGQGKSNLLLVLIHSLAAKYSPAELEMVLVDLRDGVEFARLGPSRNSPTWLPHVRALGLEFDPDYSLSVLRWVRQQMADRSGLLKASGATTLGQYRARTGKRLPRLLVVIDEFQRLFEGDDDQAAMASRELDEIARTGRGFGVHLVLASQAITGIRGLATKSESIFGQFHNRVVLKNTQAESQAFLSAHNLAAAELEYRGQAVFNDALGAIDKNKLGTVAYADPDYLERLQVSLFQQGHGAPPSIFRASAFAQWTPGGDRYESATGIVAAVGLPIEVEARPRSVALTRSPNQALAVVGSAREAAIAILIRAVTTAAQSAGPNARLTVLDGDSSGDSPKPWINALVAYLKRQGHGVEHVARREVPAKIIELGRQNGDSDIVITVALDSVDLSTPIEPDYLLPNESLRELVKSGPLNGTWTIGWWHSKTVLEEHLGYRAPGVRSWAFAGVSRDDLTDIAGHAVRAPSGSPRFVWFDRTAGAGAERLVPFEPTDVIGTVDLG